MRPIPGEHVLLSVRSAVVPQICNRLSGRNHEDLRSSLHPTDHSSVNGQAPNGGPATPHYDPECQLFGPAWAPYANQPQSRAKHWLIPRGAYLHAIHQYLWGGQCTTSSNRQGPQTAPKRALQGAWQNTRPKPDCNAPISFRLKCFFGRIGSCPVFPPAKSRIFSNRHCLLDGCKGPHNDRKPAAIPCGAAPRYLAGHPLSLGEVQGRKHRRHPVRASLHFRHGFGPVVVLLRPRHTADHPPPATLPPSGSRGGRPGSDRPVNGFGDGPSARPRAGSGLQVPNRGPCAPNVFPPSYSAGRAQRPSACHKCPIYVDGGRWTA